MQAPKDPLDTLLDQWGKGTPGPDHLEPEVWRRIAVADNPDDAPSWLDRLKTVFSRPSFSIAFAAACVLFGLFLFQLRTSQRHAERNVQLAQSYLRLIDPLLESQPGPSVEQSNANLDALLAWMKTDLQLNDDQLARIRNVHEQLSPRLVALANKVAQMQQAFASFEQTRQSAGQVDFIEFASYVEQRRRLDRECTESTRKLIAEASDVMTPQQRQQYLQLLNPALKNPGSGSL